MNALVRGKMVVKKIGSMIHQLSYRNKVDSIFSLGCKYSYGHVPTLDSPLACIIRSASLVNSAR